MNDFDVFSGFLNNNNNNKQNNTKESGKKRIHLSINCQ